MDSYLRAKLELFKDNLIEGGTAIISADMNLFSEIKSYILKHVKVKILTVGYHLQSDIRILKIKGSIDKQIVDFQYVNLTYQFETSIIGDFQIVNILTALLLLSSLGIEIQKLIPLLSHLKPVKGRLEVIRAHDKRFICINFAHTPDALYRVLLQLRKLLTLNANLILVFGCGGNRDMSKRKLMGIVANKLADYIIVTDDNPRNEDPAKIRSDIMQVLKPNNSVDISDRKVAICHAIRFHLYMKSIAIV